ncbi:hypothetical protein SeMB42_g04371 [Synchytrium endobioticum]|uniref:Aspartate-semialdehyde dehydrogenase n=1 Tax=Synchytrium endobioticum TaxID=286115 RepID=A0A507CW94_9FUNG|nr:hypothetical protein SeLEV6574_g05075 [Synchytrium endobioticum]TPX44361.1 hypothetical protein SeMB42_g04371 [Synchytrium endobioticum]
MSEPAKKKQRSGASPTTVTGNGGGAHEPREKINVGILGATGMVGQRLIQLLANHPYFTVTHLGASSRSSGKPYENAANWKQPTPVPSHLASLIIQPCESKHFRDVKIVFSGLDSDVAGPIEIEFLNANIAVFSNAKNHRMCADVPLIVPVVNTSHYDIIPFQRTQRNVERGLIVANANCSTTGLVVALKALQDAFGDLDKVMVTTMQAISGAGYPGISSIDVIDNIVPYISGEEDKLETEASKILGCTNSHNTAFVDAPLVISASCNRVPVIDGHTESVFVKFGDVSPDKSKRPVKPTIDQIKSALREYKCEAQELGVPSAPIHVIQVLEEADRPQPRLDRDVGNGMTVSVGRVRECTVFDVKFTLLSHNTILGAAGSAIMNAEVAVEKGLIL